MQHKNEDEIYDHKTLMEIQFTAEAQITQSKRVSIQILDLMGEVGGFWDAMVAILAIFGNYMSSKMFQESLARSYYLRKKNDYEVAKDIELQELKSNLGQKKPNIKDTNIENFFERIQISTFKLFMDPIIQIFMVVCSKCKCCQRQGTLRRMKILEKCDDRFAQEIDLSQILKKLRIAYNLINRTQTREFKKLQKFNKRNVIKLTDSSDDDTKLPFRVDVMKSYFTTSSDSDFMDKEQKNPVLDMIQKNIVNGMPLSNYQRKELILKKIGEKLKDQVKERLK